jgi:hypothetical protein
MLRGAYDFGDADAVVVYELERPPEGRRRMSQIGEFGFFGDCGGGFEVEVVAVGVDDQGIPHVVAYEGFSGTEIAGAKFVVDRDSVVALEAKGDAFAALIFGEVGGGIFLEH